MSVLASRGDFPRSVREITTEWLRQVLHDAGVLAGNDLASAEVSSTAAGFGAVGSYGRVHLAYARPTPDAPRTLFAKLSSDKAGVRAHAHSRGLYASEVGFYRHFAPLPGLRTPRCYFAAIEPESGESLLLLEDIAGGRGGDVLAGCSTAEAELLLREIASLHARWWNSPRLSEWKWLPGYDSETNPVTDDYSRPWPLFRQRYGRLLPPPAAETAQQALARVPAICRLLACRPQTFTHGDLSLDNARFDLPDAPAVLFDWQMSMRAPAARDVSWFLARSLPVVQRRAEGEHLVRVYHAALVEAGVSGYPLEQLWHDIKLAALLALPIIISAAVNIDFGSERGRRVVEARITRNVAMLDDHGVRGDFA